MKIKRKAKTIKALKKQLEKTLPEKISKVIESYDNFVEKGIPEDAKGFNAHHTACKSAVTHAKTLMELSKWTEGEFEKEESGKEDDVMNFLLEARRELSGLTNDDES